MTNYDTYVETKKSETHSIVKSSQETNLDSKPNIQV